MQQKEIHYYLDVLAFPEQDHTYFPVEATNHT